MNACTFIGHRSCPKNIKEKLFLEIENLIINKNVDTFFVGTHGSFDKYVYETLSELEKKYKIEIKVVLSYLNIKKDSTYYDTEKTIFPDCLAKTPPRFAISKSNNYMLKNSNYLISYLNSPFSNTITFVEEAIKQKLLIINLGSFSIDNI